MRAWPGRRVRATRPRPRLLSRRTAGVVAPQTRSPSAPRSSKSAMPFRAIPRDRLPTPASVAGRTLRARRCAGSARLQQHVRPRRRGRRDRCRFAPRGDRARMEAPAGSRHRAAGPDQADPGRGGDPRPTRGEETRAGSRRRRDESRASRPPRLRCRPRDRSAGVERPRAGMQVRRRHRRRGVPLLCRSAPGPMCRLAA